MKELLALAMTVAEDETLKPHQRAIFLLMYAYPHKFSQEYLYMRYCGINAPIINKQSEEYKQVKDAVSELQKRGYILVNNWEGCKEGEEEYTLNQEMADTSLLEYI